MPKPDGMSKYYMLLVSTALIVSGCVSATTQTNVVALREWANASAESTQVGNTIASYVETTDRLIVLDNKRAEAWRAQAEIRVAQAEAVKIQLDVVGEYMASLSALAAGSFTDFSADLAGVTRSLIKTTQASDATIGAVGSLVKVLLNAGAQAWSRGRMSDFIEQANGPLQEILNGSLLRMVDSDFRRDVEVEALLIDLYYEDLLRGPAASTTARAALAELFSLRLYENEKRQQAVDSVGILLKKISEGHQLLFENRDNLDSQQLAQRLFKLTLEIRRNAGIILQM